MAVLLRVLYYHDQIQHAGGAPELFIVNINRPPSNVSSFRKIHDHVRPEQANFAYVSSNSKLEDTGTDFYERFERHKI